MLTSNSQRVKRDNQDKVADIMGDVSAIQDGIRQIFGTIWASLMTLLFLLVFTVMLFVMKFILFSNDNKEENVQLGAIFRIFGLCLLVCWFTSGNIRRILLLRQPTSIFDVSSIAILCVPIIFVVVFELEPKFGFPCSTLDNFLKYGEENVVLSQDMCDLALFCKLFAKKCNYERMCLALSKSVYRTLPY